MALTTLWSDSAIAELQTVHDYYLTKAGSKVASKIVNSFGRQIPSTC